MVIPNRTRPSTEPRDALAQQIANARLQRLETQNKNLSLDYEAKAGGYVLLADIVRQVRAANVSVRNQVLAVIERAHLAPDDKRALRLAMTDALNDLAYERDTSNPDA